MGGGAQVPLRLFPVVSPVLYFKLFFYACFQFNSVQSTLFKHGKCPSKLVLRHIVPCFAGKLVIKLSSLVPFLTMLTELLGQ